MQMLQSQIAAQEATCRLEGHGLASGNSDAALTIDDELEEELPGSETSCTSGSDSDDSGSGFDSDSCSGSGFD